MGQQAELVHERDPTKKLMYENGKWILKKDNTVIYETGNNDQVKDCCPQGAVENLLKKFIKNLLRIY